MNTIFYLPTLMVEWLKANLLSVKYYEPSTESIRVVEENVRNEMRLASYYAKRTVYGRND